MVATILYIIPYKLSRTLQILLLLEKNNSSVIYAGRVNLWEIHMRYVHTMLK